MKQNQSIGIWFFLLLPFFLTLGYGFETFAPYETYELPFSPQYWYFSPFNDGKIWLTGVSSTAHEFDPASGQCSPLTARLWDFAVYLGDSDSVCGDAYNPHLVWICNFNKGLMAYHQPSRSAVKYLRGKYFNYQALTKILPARESVWIATSDGLYRLRRADWKIEAVAKTQGIFVSDMRLAGSDEILFSGGAYGPDDSLWYRYLIASGQMEKVRFPLRLDPVSDIMATVKPGTGLDVTQINDIWDDDDLVWFVDYQGLGRIEKKSGRLVYLDLGWSWRRWPRALLPGRSHIWVLCGNKLLKVDKNPPAAILADAAAMKTQQQKIAEMYSAIRDEKNGIVIFQKVAHLLDLANRYRQGSDGREGLFRNVMSLMREHGRKNIQSMKEYLQSKSVDPAVAPFVLYGLLCASLYAGDPGQALHYYDRLAERYPGSEVLQRITLEEIQTMKDGEAELKRIKSGRLLPDRRFWEMGNAYCAMMRVEWNSGESGYDMTLPYSYFSRLVERYPRSEYADNAWWVLNLSEGDWEGIYGMYFLDTMLPKYREFLARYPKSELVPKAKYLMAWSMFSTVKYSIEPENRDILPLEKHREYLETAKKMCAEAIRGGLLAKDVEGYPPPTETMEQIEKYLQKYTGKPVK